MIFSVAQNACMKITLRQNRETEWEMKNIIMLMEEKWLTGGNGSELIRTVTQVLFHVKSYKIAQKIFNNINNSKKL